MRDCGNGGELKCWSFPAHLLLWAPSVVHLRTPRTSPHFRCMGQWVSWRFQDGWVQAFCLHCNRKTNRKVFSMEMHRYLQDSWRVIIFLTRDLAVFIIFRTSFSFKPVTGMALTAPFWTSCQINLPLMRLLLAPTGFSPVSWKPQSFSAGNLW